MMTPSGSRDAEPFSVIVVSVCVSWLAPASAIGIWFGRVVLVVVGIGELVVVGVASVVVGVPVPIVAVVWSPADDHVPRLSWTQRLAVNVPVAVYVCATVGVPTVAVTPSPNCQ